MVDSYFNSRKKELFYKGKWHVSYATNSGNTKIKKRFLKELCSKCSGNEVKLMLMILDSVPETDNPYESGVVKIVEADWTHVLTGKPFRDAIETFVSLGYLAPTPIRSRYVINPNTWCKIKEK